MDIYFLMINSNNSYICYIINKFPFLIYWSFLIYFVYENVNEKITDFHFIIYKFK